MIDTVAFSCHKEFIYRDLIQSIEVGMGMGRSGCKVEGVVSVKKVAFYFGEG